MKTKKRILAYIALAIFTVSLGACTETSLDETETQATDLTKVKRPGDQNSGG